MTRPSGLLTITISAAMALSACSGGTSQQAVGATPSPPATTETASPSSSPTTEAPVLEPFGTAVQTVSTGPTEVSDQLFSASADAALLLSGGLGSADETGGGPSLVAVDAAGHLGDAKPLTPEGGYVATCGVVSTTVGGAGTVSLLHFDIQAAEGVKPASYEVDLETYDASLTLVSTLVLARDVKGEPKCKPQNLNGRQHGTFNQLDPNEWQVGDSSADGAWVGVAYSPRQGTSRILLASPAASMVKTIKAEPDQVVGNAVIYECGNPDDSMDYRICSGSFAKAKQTLLYQEKHFTTTTNSAGYCGVPDANCSYVPFRNSAGLTALSASNINGDGSVAIVDPLTGRARWKTAGLNEITSSAAFPGDGTVAVGGPASSDTGTSLVEAFTATGKKLWQAEADRVCGATDDGFVVTANDQLALLDAATGEQKASTTDVTSCPQVSRAGVGLWRDDPDGPTTVSLKP